MLSTCWAPPALLMLKTIVDPRAQNMAAGLFIFQMEICLTLSVGTTGELVK